MGGWGQKIGQICGVFSSKDSKNAHFLTFFERLHPPNNFKNKKQALGALPQTPLSLARPQGAGGKPYPPTPTVSVGSIQGVKGKMHDFVALDPSPSPWGSKTNRSGRSWKPVKACRSNRVAASLYRLEATTLCGKGAGGFPCTLPRGERGCGQRPRCWQDPWGSRSRKMCRRHSF